MDVSPQAKGPSSSVGGSAYLSKYVETLCDFKGNHHMVRFYLVKHLPRKALIGFPLLKQFEALIDLKHGTCELRTIGVTLRLRSSRNGTNSFLTLFPPYIDDIKVNSLALQPPQEEPILFGNFSNLELRHLATLDMETIAHSDNYAHASLSDKKGEWFTFADTKMKRPQKETDKDIQVYGKNLVNPALSDNQRIADSYFIPWKDFSPRLCT